MKKIFFCVICILFAFSISACKNQPSPNENVENSETNITISNGSVVINKDEMVVPNGVVINSFKAINDLQLEFPAVSNYLYNLITEDFFCENEIILINFYHSSSEKDIKFLSFEIEGEILKLFFEIDSPEALDSDFNAKPYIFAIKRNDEITHFKIEVYNKTLNNNSGGWNLQIQQLIYY